MNLYKNWKIIAALAFNFVTATMYIFSCLTWKKDVEPKVAIGDLISGFEITWILKTSDNERLFVIVIIKIYYIEKFVKFC